MFSGGMMKIEFKADKTVDEVVNKIIDGFSGIIKPKEREVEAKVDCPHCNNIFCEFRHLNRL